MDLCSFPYILILSKLFGRRCHHQVLRVLSCKGVYFIVLLCGFQLMSLVCIWIMCCVFIMFRVLLVSLQGVIRIIWSFYWFIPYLISKFWVLYLESDVGGESRLGKWEKLCGWIIIKFSQHCNHRSNKNVSTSLHINILKWLSYYLLHTPSWITTMSFRHDEAFTPHILITQLIIL